METSNSNELEIAFGPSVKGGILKASKGKKRQPEPESDDAEDDQSGEDMEEDQEGASGSEEEDGNRFWQRDGIAPSSIDQTLQQMQMEFKKEDMDRQQVTSKEGYVQTINHVYVQVETYHCCSKKKWSQGKVVDRGPVKKAHTSLYDMDLYDFLQYF